ncbi:hypothetical protein QBC34DRAFT_397749 [Podospora aff. communis PSN243]|uniref:Uncharacterized protein n=1 Tax=Podospora aff. communis PSN243 TaxID=3040156 RepID=A0AAV9GW04_9PEZI|nr:hypothetical protein QBC34DRAFT_397749 [Podospora aff. communis PSN243]
MKLLTLTILSLASLPSVLAFGEACYYYDGAKYGNVHGTCGPESWCLQGMGYRVAGRCPGDHNNRCCIRRDCVTSLIAFPGKCTTVEHCRNVKGPGHSSPGVCPGPSNIQCCI